MLKALWLERLRSMFWVLPACIAIAIVATLPFLASIRHTSSWPAIQFILRDLSAEGAHEILSSIATSLMTVVGVLFSITIVVLQQVSTQYSPRVIERFIRSRTSQVVFGVFIGSFVYSLLLLRQIPPSADPDGLPQVATATAIVLAISCFGLLVHFIQYILQSIKSTSIIEAITETALQALDHWENELTRTYRPAPHRPSEQEIQRFATHEHQLYARHRGYIQAYDWREVSKPLCHLKWKIEVLARIGEYVQQGTPLLKIFSDRALSRDDIEVIHKAIAMGNERTHAQDIAYGIRQLVDIALRALSPSLNDPTTAEEVLNGIEAILLRWSKYDYARPELKIDHGTIVMTDLNDEEISHLAFAQILRSGHEFPLIVRRIRTIRRRLEESTARPELIIAVQGELSSWAPI